jgi:hypothetical protein
VRPLGKNQLSMLLSLSNPGNLMVVGDKMSESLERRGLARHYAEKKGRPNGFIRITPAGLRALADAYEIGLIDQFMGETFRKITKDGARP